MTLWLQRPESGHDVLWRCGRDLDSGIMEAEGSAGNEWDLSLVTIVAPQMS